MIDDEKARESLASILDVIETTSRKKRKKADLRRRYGDYDYKVSYTRSPKPKSDPTEGRCWERDDMSDTAPISTKDQEAILSLDPAKAAAVLRTAYNPEFVTKMKDTIPQSERRWDPTNRVWVFHPSALPKLKPLCEQYYKCVRVVGVQKQIPATKFDQLLAKLDKCDKQAIYIILAKKYHPDTGHKDKTIMPLINTVFDK